ncbi:hypothetical protein GCM10010365_05820 [Streptomyces poonensis]|uniref:Uncharacterized protein n=1 Tax=Streptomyces poonensis TaxID=68255 RepID=A0A918P9E0_9ACTN|nr:hypothetical protein GCM10010365_05820 [Streptomyces poonensis]GLJ87981.1 hypothetical protein GCM10017589_05810 [Streptomyces poonensis]
MEYTSLITDSSPSPLRRYALGWSASPHERYVGESRSVGRSGCPIGQAGQWPAGRPGRATERPFPRGDRDRILFAVTNGT